MSDQSNYPQKFTEVLEAENDILRRRRARLYDEQFAGRLQETRFGIALSGGGIRSATINLGLLRTLNHFGILKRADYLSSVSGGGYTNAYIQTILKEEGAYEALFSAEHTDYMRSRGEYLIPGQTRLQKFLNTLLLTWSYAVGLLMSWISPGILVAIGFVLFQGGRLLVSADGEEFYNEFYHHLQYLYKYGVPVLLALVGVHYLANMRYVFKLGISRTFTRLELGVLLTLLMGVVVAYFAAFFSLKFPDREQFLMGGVIILGLILLGFLTNPNGVSFHRFYRARLADVFLHFADKNKNTLLSNIHFDEETERDQLSPYPLINTTLNLRSISGDPRFMGSKANDYFLLSPLYCGAKLTGYVPTKSFPGYREMTLPAATTISAAAVNPGMGMFSTGLVRTVMTLLNARLGFWVNNPLRYASNYLVWWPWYFWKELTGALATNNKKLNISDGAHIENLAVYELLRRRCRLIFAIDAGADPGYTFDDLENLTIRARNELGMDIVFREDQVPEEVIRPRPSHGYSGRRYAVADVYKLWEEFEVEDSDGNPVCTPEGRPVEALVNYSVDENDDKIDFTVRIKGRMSTDEGANDQLVQQLQKRVRARIRSRLWASTEEGRSKLKTGVLVYIKSSVVAPMGKPLFTPDTPAYQYNTYKYKIYHPAFPHEPTSDQFFDPVQWESYYQLGQYIGADVLGVPNLKEYQEGERAFFEIDPDELLAHFEEGNDLFYRQKTDMIETEMAPLPDLMDAPTRARGIGGAEMPSEAEEREEIVEQQTQYKM